MFSVARRKVTIVYTINFSPENKPPLLFDYQVLFTSFISHGAPCLLVRIAC